MHYFQHTGQTLHPIISTYHRCRHLMLAHTAITAVSAAAVSCNWIHVCRRVIVGVNLSVSSVYCYYLPPATETYQCSTGSLHAKLAQGRPQGTTVTLVFYQQRPFYHQSMHTNEEKATTTVVCVILTCRHTHNRFTALLDFVRDYPGEPAPER